MMPKKKSKKVKWKRVPVTEAEAPSCNRWRTILLKMLRDIGWSVGTSSDEDSNPSVRVNRKGTRTGV